MLSNLAPYLNVTKDCTDGSQGCFPTGVTYKFLTPSKGNDSIYDNMVYPKLKLTDGTTLMAYGILSAPVSKGTSPALQNIYGYYYADINGYKGPNQIGKDVFLFYLTKYGIIPLGTSQEISGYTFSGFCKDKDTTYGWGCTAWVIYNENLDYLHCNNLDWNGLTQCR